MIDWLLRLLLQAIGVEPIAGGKSLGHPHHHGDLGLLLGAMAYGRPCR